MSNAPSVMILSDIRDILKAVVLARKEDMGMQIERAYCADLMSDVLAFSISHSLLITGLTNTQVIRTAEVATITAIVFIQNKRPDIQTIALADEKKIPLLVTDLSMFDTCGLLFEKGLRSCNGLEF
ncbi:MAG: transcriptional regulator [Nitrospirota bacterium]|nr:transcriptional regulator [Nitrospirota bacterium]